MTPLEPGYEPTEVDIICARGRSVYNHEGNHRFRGILRENLEKYKSATTKQQKTTVVNALLDEIKGESRFVRKLADGTWVEVAEHVAKEKIGQGFRDLLHTEYRSSTKSKVRLRRERRSRMKSIEEPAAKVQGSTSGKLHRSTNSSDFLEPLPLDESAETLLYECDFSFEGKEERKIAAGDGEKTAVEEELPRDPKVQDEKIGKEKSDVGVEAPPAPQGDAVESSRIPAPTFVSPASPAQHQRLPRSFHSPAHHGHPPDPYRPPYRPHPHPASPADYRHHHHYPHWRHHSPPVDNRNEYYPHPQHPHPAQPSPPLAYGPNHQHAGERVSPPPYQYYPQLHAHPHSPHPPLPFPHPHSPHQSPYGYPPHYYQGPHWSDYHPSYHPPLQPGQHDPSAAEHSREDPRRRNVEGRYRYYYHEYGPPG